MWNLGDCRNLKYLPKQLCLFQCSDKNCVAPLRLSFSIWLSLTSLIDFFASKSALSLSSTPQCPGIQKLSFFFDSSPSTLSSIIGVIRNMLFLVEVLLIPFCTLSESEKIMQLCSESAFSMISSVSPIFPCEHGCYYSCSGLYVYTTAYTYANLKNGEFSIFEPSVAGKLASSHFFVEHIFVFLVEVLCFLYLSSFTEGFIWE
jgi:hypothetical protein